MNTIKWEMKKNQFIVDKKKVLYAWIMVSIGVLFITNLLTPPWADDFTNVNHLYTLNGDFLKKFFQSQINIYATWGGRIVGSSITMLLLSIDRIWFHILNTVVYIIFTYMLVLHSGVKKKMMVVWFIITHFALWIFLPSFWESILWVTGSGNYLWPFTILLVVLYPYRVYMESEKSPLCYNTIRFAVLMFFLGIVAGCTNENTGLAFWVTITLYLVYLKKVKKVGIALWMYSGNIGAIIGWIIMVMAPGNFRRAQAMGLQSASMLKQCLTYFVKETAYFFDYFGWIFIMLGFLLGIYVWVQGEDIKKILHRLLFYSSFLLITIYSMIVVGGIADRGWLFPLSFLIIVVGNVFAELDFQEIKLKRFLNIFLVGIIFISVSSYVLSIVNNAKIFKTMKELEQKISIEKEKGNMDVVYQLTFETRNTHSVPIYRLSPDSEFWINAGMAEYYGIDSLSVLSMEMKEY